MAASMTFSYDDGYDKDGHRGPIRSITADWVSSSGGAVSSTTLKINGFLLKAVTDPGSAAPTDDYDIALTDENGSDILSGSVGSLADRDTSNTEVVNLNIDDGAGGLLPVYPMVSGKITVAVTNAGDTKNGQLILYYQACG